MNLIRVFLSVLVSNVPVSLWLSCLRRLSVSLPNKCTCFSEWIDCSSSAVAFLLWMHFKNRPIMCEYSTDVVLGKSWTFICLKRTSHWFFSPLSFSLDQTLWILPECSGWRLLSPHEHWCLCIWESYARPRDTHLIRISFSRSLPFSSLSWSVPDQDSPTCSEA